MAVGTHLTYRHQYSTVNFYIMESTSSFSIITKK